MLASRPRKAILGLLLVVTVGLVAAPVAMSAGGGRRAPTERCAGRIVARRLPVILTATHVRVVSDLYSSRIEGELPAYPKLRCRGARKEVRAYLLAKLSRPENLCAGPASAGGFCRVRGWNCGTYRPGAASEEVCEVTYFDARRGTGRSTLIKFTESDRQG